MDYMEVVKMSVEIGGKMLEAVDVSIQEGHKGIQDGVHSIESALFRLQLVINVINCGPIPHTKEKAEEPLYLSLADTLVQTPGVLEQLAKDLHMLIDRLASSLTLTGV